MIIIINFNIFNPYDFKDDLSFSVTTYYSKSRAPFGGKGGVERS